jgi:hypothetical protein
LPVTQSCCLLLLHSCVSHGALANSYPREPTSVLLSLALFLSPARSPAGP